MMKMSGRQYSTSHNPFPHGNDSFRIIMFIALHGIYEPSGHPAVARRAFFWWRRNEKEFPFSLLTIHPDGSTTQQSLIVDSGDESPGKLDDLEGLTTDSAGFVYAITSHSRNSKGEEKKSREKLVRFRVRRQSAHLCAYPQQPEARSYGQLIPCWPRQQPSPM
jgi:hypothetical protein